jgi:hypothetical protein
MNRMICPGNSDVGATPAYIVVTPISLFSSRLIHGVGVTIGRLDLKGSTCPFGVPTPPFAGGTAGGAEE